MSINIVYANKMQQEVLESKARLTVVTAEPGAGSTTALLLKAYKHATENKSDVTFFVATATHVDIIMDYVKKLFNGDYRYSSNSMIVTFQNGGKIKFVSCQGDAERTLGFSNDLMLFDISICNKFVQRNIMRAFQAVVIDSIESLERPGSWAQELGLLNLEGGKPTGFVEGINHITGSIDENFLFGGDREHYKGLVKKSIPGRMKVEFGSAVV